MEKIAELMIELQEAIKDELIDRIREGRDLGENDTLWMLKSLDNLPRMNETELVSALSNLKKGCDF